MLSFPRLWGIAPPMTATATAPACHGSFLSQEFVSGLKAKGRLDFGVFAHAVKNAAPTALAVTGLQLGYPPGGSILIETVFSWPGTGFLLGQAIFQRDLPLLQGAILALAVVLALVLMAIFAPWVAPNDPYRSSMIRRLRPIGTPGFPLGTDEPGRDMLSRTSRRPRLAGRG